MRNADLKHIRSAGAGTRFSFLRPERLTAGWLVALVSLLALLFLAASAPLLSAVTGLSYAEQDTSCRLSPPVSGCPGADGGGGFHLLGTDLLGRDVAVRLLYGLGISMAVALSAAAVSFLLGTLLGLACGLAGGWSDRLLLRLLEVLQSIPFLFVVILVSMFSRDVMRVRWADPGAQAMAQAVLLFCCLGAIQWFSLARYARGLAFSLKTAPFVEALVGLGIPRRRIVLRHVLPNTLKPLAAYAVLLVPTLVLEEAFLSFLGFGIQPPYPSLGILLSESVAFMDVRPTLVLIPATTLLVLTWSLNVVAEMLSGRSAVPAALAREDS